MVCYMDTVIGNLTRAMREMGLWENTLFLCSSDNGGPVQGGQGANNAPLRGGKVHSGPSFAAFAPGPVISSHHHFFTSSHHPFFTSSHHHFLSAFDQQLTNWEGGIRVNVSD
jgi:hypothetical protein